MSNRGDDEGRGLKIIKSRILRNEFTGFIRLSTQLSYTL